MKIQNATIEDVFKDLLEGKSISDYFILTLTKFEDKSRKRTIQAKSVEKTPFEVLKEIVKEDNRCLVKIDKESE